SEPALSPDGRLVAFTMAAPDERTNKVPSDLWIVGADGSGLRRLTAHPAADRHPVWSPDGKWILFESTRSGSSQIWMTSPDGKEVRQLTSIAGGASEPVLSPDGRTLAFVSEVFPEFSDRPFPLSDSLNRMKLQELEQAPGTPRLFTQLLYRHWDHWVEGKRQHIFVQSFPAGEPRDLTPGDRDAVPSSSTFSANPDYSFSPDGREIAYTATPTPTRREAWCTNHDVYVVPVSGGPARQLTANQAADASPQFSPDGRYLAYRAQQRPGYEGDRWELVVLDRKTGTSRSLTASLDQHVGAFRWAPDSRTIFFESSVEASGMIFAVTLEGKGIRRVVEGGSNHALSISPDGRTLFFTRASAVRPAEIFRAGTDGKGLRAVTGLNDSLFAALEIPAPSAFWYKGAAGARVHSWLYTPPGFDRTKRYPLIMLVHGGPQGAWEDSWSYRWNPALWAAQGYVVMAPNPRGSTGFGQKFTDGINGDWGGKVFADLMSGLDTICTMPFVDSTRKGAAGASFGGYMMNWFLGHTGTRFSALVSHDGVYNFESMYGATDEVWFDEWEHGGAPWEAPEEYARFSPHRYAKEFKTPTLVIHGGRDFRIPETEAMQLFTALQRQGVPSAFLYFPDENHWVLKPSNSMLWHKTVFEWLERYVKRGGTQAMKE
ncbi:MAG TPA: S9 family peptidase, partial [Bacteroidota bacterium]